MTPQITAQRKGILSVVSDWYFFLSETEPIQLNVKPTSVAGLARSCAVVVSNSPSILPVLQKHTQTWYSIHLTHRVNALSLKTQSYL